MLDTEIENALDHYRNPGVFVDYRHVVVLSTYFTDIGYPVSSDGRIEEVVARLESTWLTVKQVRSIRSDLTTPLSEGAL